MNSIKRTKYACYATNLTMSVVGNISPLLFVTFNSMYGISFTLLGLLIFICFSTQLVVDLIFSFLSHRFNIRITVKATPMIATAGMIIYALSPMIFGDNVYIGLIIGTMVFSAASGLSEVLTTPVIAALPSDDTSREVSKLHSVYAWGVVFVVVFSTLFIHFCSSKNWPWLILIFTIIPVTASLLFFGAEIPQIDSESNKVSGGKPIRIRCLMLCVIAIFFGGATECVMAQWASSYLEAALGIPKLVGDIAGIAAFMIMLGLGRSLYAKIGKNVCKVMLLGAVFATICYIAVATSAYPIIGVVACALTGLFASMLWPGSLIVSSSLFPKGGVFLYAIMAAGGDLGAALAPQLVGAAIDIAAATPWLNQASSSLGVSIEELSMRLALLIGAVFAAFSALVYYLLFRVYKKYTKEEVAHH